jgi:hypothetical protein
VTAGKRIVGGFFVLMIGLGTVLDTSWDWTGGAVSLAGAALLVWGATVRG